MSKIISDKIGPKLRKAINIEFLFTFTKELMINSIPEEILKNNIKSYRNIRIPVKYPKITIKSKQKQFFPLRPKMIREVNTRKFNQQSSEFQESIIHSKPLIQIKKELTSQYFDLGEINPFIDDPTITYIECPGPNKFILINKDGETQVTKINLNENEIENIIKTFSEKSNTPIDSPVFKASLGNSSITAIHSDVIGSRFIIEKNV